MDDKTITAVQDAVEKLSAELISLTQDLVRIPSTVGHEGPAQEFMASRMRAEGLAVETFEPDKQKLLEHPAFVDSEEPFESRHNVIGRWDGDPAKRSIILNGHIDVVSPEPVDQWTVDPWGGEVHGNRLYGRGSLDMKGGLAVHIIALKALRKAGLEPGGSVMVQSVLEEEAGGGGGTLACLTEGYTADAMLITEPGSEICVAHAGVLYFRVSVEGRTAHAGQADRGINAIGKMYLIYHALSKLDALRRGSVRFPLFQTDGSPACHLNLGKMRSGDWPSTVAGFAELEGRVSFVPGETREQIQALIERTIQEAVQGDAWFAEVPPQVTWFGWKAEPWQQDSADPFVQALRGNVEKVTGRQVELCGKSAGLDTRFCSYFNIPAVTFGPIGGSTHACDEYVDLDTLLVTCKVVALTVLDWCSKAKA
ncbi:MAG: ArgE/DapE family deacylase [Desulfarculaceae bacterium]|nr:ArgE/DapE family deacylase [Desulfarculaceae bacterium]MCF8047753.1 ArgE/DapE family deacylase [Desulfarculaceae bacterium]MCF8065065.1 ArgE/DapE family deacylase [Desulfarculaceae bacterium]MCF8098650.1 ArgE/DapE family deacylase [Desulfarculaceae bacterium]